MCGWPIGVSASFHQLRLGVTRTLWCLATKVRKSQICWHHRGSSSLISLRGMIHPISSAQCFIWKQGKKRSDLLLIQQQLKSFLARRVSWISNFWQSLLNYEVLHSILWDGMSCFQLWIWPILRVCWILLLWVMLAVGVNTLSTLVKDYEREHSGQYQGPVLGSCPASIMSLYKSAE